MRALNSSSPTESAGSRSSTGLPVTAAGLAALTGAAVARQGAFHIDESVVVAVGAAILAAVGLTAAADRSARRVLAAVAALAGWWLLSSARGGRWSSFLPMGAGMIGFAAAFVVIRGLTEPARRTSCLILAGIGSAAAVTGLVGVAFRLFPVAARAENTWRVSTTVTYANASGLLLAMSLLVALGLRQDTPLPRVLVCLCTAGLIGTQSRGAVIALVAGAGFVPWDKWRSAAPGVFGGAAAGLAVVAASPPTVYRPVAAVIVLGAVTVASAIAALSASTSWLRIPGLRRAGAALALAAIVAVVVVRHGTISRRITLADRTPEWSAAFHQWTSHVLLGAGADRPLLISAPTQTYAAFAHSEYLQVLAGSGLIGGVLLMIVAVTLAFAVRRHDELASSAAGALMAFAAAGLFDFDWHVPAVALAAGWAAGVASPSAGHRGVDLLAR